MKNIPKNDATTTIKLTSMYYYYDASSYTSDRVYNKFFDIDNKFYWLCSRAVDISSNYTNFDVRRVDNGGVYAYYLFSSNGAERAVSYAVRPVVTLQSGVTTDEIQILGEQTEPVW